MEHSQFNIQLKPKTSVKHRNENAGPRFQNKRIRLDGCLLGEKDFLPASVNVIIKFALRKGAIFHI